MTATLHPDYAKAQARVKEAGFEPADPLKVSIDEARAAQDRYFKFLAGTPPEVADVQNRTLEGPAGSFGVRLYYPSKDRALPVIVFVRGGGWWAGSLDSHDRTMRLLANKSGFTVCGIDYHRAPEARFPTQLNELLACVQWLRKEGASLGIDSKRMVLMGESAGATLSALAAVKLVEQRAEQVNGLVLFYGNFGGPTEQTRAYSRWVWKNLLGTDQLPADPAAIPTKQKLEGLPPAWLGVGECDPLVGDSLEFAEKLKGAGIPHTLKRYPGVPHAFVMMSRLYKGADEALDDAAAAARRFIR
jgi:acetyl esterase